MSRSNELMEKAAALSKLFNEVVELAKDNDYGLEFDTSDGTMEFNDWLSSSCYGEGDDGFGVNADGSIWQSSSC
ncbi:hypothetical protein PP427_gp160 [Salmonella phage KM16]|uniref:hypothetical protein n=1 Tax=Salmonella phage KM16 TaxID=2797303 RepID=UPI0024925693|nr:hypothetical protein PP427_gp160 [Salmonella phage KM16]